jgi:hypothetical protein
MYFVLAIFMVRPSPKCTLKEVAFSTVTSCSYWYWKYVLTVLCANSVYLEFVAVTLCVVYQFLLEAGLLSFV